MRCKECGLVVRCGDMDKHKAGYSHKTRVKTLADKAKAKEKANYGR